jgi:hypothetical protein
MSQCDIEFDWTCDENGAWFGVCELPRKLLFNNPQPKP